MKFGLKSRGRLLGFPGLEFRPRRLSRTESLKTAGKRFSDLCDLLSTLFHDQVKVQSFVEEFDNLHLQDSHRQQGSE